MTEPQSHEDAADDLDPKEQMRQALEAKRTAQHVKADGTGPDKTVGHAQGKAAAKRQFRRKSGG